MKKKKVIAVVLAVLVVLIIAQIILSRQESVSEVIDASDEKGVVGGVNEMLPAYCVTDHGMLYGKNNTIRYMDLNTDKEYILCDKANCLHLTTNCSAYYGNALKMTGLALYGDKVYYFDYDQEGNSYNFIKMDTDGNNKKILAKIDLGDYKEGNWKFSSIQNAVYSDDMVWVESTSEYISEDLGNPSCRQWFGIQLDTGKITYLSELNLEESDCDILGFMDNKLLLAKRWANVKKLSKDEFEEQYKKGVFEGKLEGTAWDYYYEYANNWFFHNGDFREAYYVYDVDKKEEKLLEELPARIIYKEDGYSQGGFYNYLSYGEYDGGFLCEEVAGSWDEFEQYELNIFKWNLEDGSKTNVIHMEKAGIMGSSDSYHHIIDDKYVLLKQHKENDVKEIGMMDLDNGSVQPLFEQSGDVSYQFVGTSSDYYVIKDEYSTNFFGAKEKIYKIKKEDYKKGKLNNREFLMNHSFTYTY